MSEPTSAEIVARQQRYRSCLFWFNMAGVALNAYTYYRTGSEFAMFLALLGFGCCLGLVGLD